MVAATTSCLAVILCISYLGREIEGFNFLPRIYDRSYNTSLVRIKRQNQGNCEDGFQCKTIPQCISTDNVCDGTSHCTDGSDETEAVCKEQICPGYLFHCSYGACISSDKRCNGVKDCQDNSDETGCPNTAKINSNCRSDQFECDNGQCIDGDYRCNGEANCEDKSDETEELCLNIYCPGYTYKCAYGACVDGDARCNGIQNCFDLSDEKDCGVTTPPTIPTRRPPTDTTDTKGKCKTPPHPEMGRWYHASSDAAAVAGQFVEPRTIINVTCDSGFRLSSTHEDSILIPCISGGVWKSPIPHCQKLCPPIYSTSTLTVKCREDITQNLIPCNRATDGTILTYECAKYYEAESHKTRTCSDGNWDFTRPSCKTVCGEKKVTAEPLVVNGKTVEAGNYPWMAALYSNKDQRQNVFINICGGSLLSTSIVLTAAHCVASDKNGKIYPARYYQVAAGKYYNKYMDPRDIETAQYSEVAKIVVHEDYRGDAQNFRSDIAVLKLSKTFALSKVVQPVCYLGISDINLEINSLGVVTGWGYTTAVSTVADSLKELEIPYKDYDTCEKEFSQEWALKYFTSDKMCAGYFNKNTSVCKGDSGGALVFRHPLSHRFYVHGVVSVGPSFKKDSLTHCDIQKSALFTKVDTYFTWLQSKIYILSRNDASS
ncbi:hypothetical protein GWI33_020266 [Rhynchophorus ferrugineus]|uniref:Uncharacterized protein n=1 Tax=Rhynchophorus ferrugineus TaxID=354439 RepID=A0A834HUP2_RHYFE|nr:hypothetical protein GWI33_020266 [Rhynchophorus ferrugineus]